jgi:hypothetical protein
MYILKSYAGIGGHSQFCGDTNRVAAVEYDVDIAKVYQDHFPNDGYNLDGYKLPNKRQVLRNCVLPALGKHVFDQVKP